MSSLADDVGVLVARAGRVSPEEVDEIVELAQSITERATVEDVPLLVEAMRLPEADFWSRELLSEAVCYLGGPEYLEDLIEMEQLGRDEGHDNGGFCTFLTEMVERDPVVFGAKLRELKGREGYPYRESVDWLLEYCEEV